MLFNDLQVSAKENEAVKNIIGDLMADRSTVHDALKRITLSNHKQYKE
jgi:hypothetical protein